MGLADFLDVNIPVGKLVSQIQIIKRLLNQAGVADILEVNLDKASLARAQATIASLPAASIPVSFDVAQLPVTGPLMALSEKVPVAFDVASLTTALGPAELTARKGLRIPVSFDVSKLPVTGPVWSTAGHLPSAGAVDPAVIASLAALLRAEKQAAGGAAIMDGSLMKTALSVVSLRQALAGASAQFAVSNGSMMTSAAAAIAARQGYSSLGLTLAGVSNAYNILSGRSMAVALNAIQKQKAAIVTAIPLWKGAGGWFGFLTGKVQLFGGALTALGIPPILAAASAAHILIDAAIEIAAVFIPAGIAIVAFGAMAAPTLNDIQKKMQAVWTTSQALNTAIYPLTGALKNLEYAVKPSVIQLFGEALVVAEHNTGMFTTVATQAGQALDTLGARAAVALTSGGMAVFLKQGPADLAMIGDIIANIFGTIGNLLRVIPGYAQTLFGALDGLTKGIESFTGSAIGQEIGRWGLAVHGFILWAGLGATAAVFLGNALLRLAANFGLVAAGTTVFNAAQFGTGIKAMLSGTGLLAGEMVTLGAGEDIAAAGALTLGGAWTAITAISPVVWIGAAIGGLIALALWLGRTRSATQSYNDAVNASIAGAPALQVAGDITNRMADTLGNLRAAQDKLNRTQEYGNTLYARGGPGVKTVTQAYAQQAAVVSGYRTELATLQGYQANYNTALKAAGGNTSYLTGTSISLNDAITKGGSTLAQYLIEVQANADAQKALALGTGRAAAAQQAQVNIFMTETLPAMQKVTAAEDNIVSLLLSGEQAFTGFDQALETYGTDLGKSADKLLGLNNAQVTQASDLYSTVLPAFQKTIDAAQQMGVHTQDLVPIIATEAKQVLTLAGNNDTARAAMVAMINNALGPGTVSYKSLNDWLKRNSTSQQGLTADWAKATIQASTLAGVLQQDLNAQLAASLLKSSGATAEIDKLTYAITHGGTQTQAYRSARQQLIQDLINTGLNATDAKSYVSNLQTQINALHGKTVNVGLTNSGSGSIIITGTGIATRTINTTTGQVRAVGGHTARGALITQGTTPTADDVLAMVSKGETIVSAADSKRLAGIFKKMGIPGYAGGGIVGMTAGARDQMAMADADFASAADMAFAMAAVAASQAAAKTAAVAASAAIAFGSSSPGVETVARYVMSHGGNRISGAGVGGVVAGESGGNPEVLENGRGPGAGILQWTPASSAFPIRPIITGNVGRDMSVQLIDMMAYIGSRGGIASLNNAGSARNAAWLFSAMEAPAVLGSDIRMNVVDSLYAAGLRYGGKVMDKGGWLRPGWNPPMYNGTGRPEPVGSAAGGTITLEITGTTGSGTFDSFLTAWLKNNVRVKGGGNVQKAWGRAH